MKVCRADADHRRARAAIAQQERDAQRPEHHRELQRGEHVRRGGSQGQAHRGQAGDLHVATFVFTTTTSVTGPAGWTALYTPAAQGTVQMAAYYAISPSSDPTSTPDSVYPIECDDEDCDDTTSVETSPPEYPAKVHGR